MESGLVWWCRLLLLAGVVTVGCRGHGRLLEPVSRASAWRLGWPTPVDYDDNQGFCGGFWRQHEVNSGKCGICGDPWDEEQRPHEAPGGPYATGTIVRHYVQAQVITLIVDITSNHRGHFEVSICPDPEVEATQECLDMYPLPLADGSGYEYNISLNTGEHSLQLMLPPHLTCTHCVLQWRYVAGNNWGICEDGSGALGCGPQEEFRACADVAVSQPSPRTRLGFRRALQPSSSRETGGGRPLPPHHHRDEAPRSSEAPSPAAKHV
ncbi:uncharacterized protein [Panulirus ornatus]|uniref:uncharacterized protein n=1 Tax=Panulirus ornatus TaxID=150431 RepID=UPI003A860935